MGATVIMACRDLPKTEEVKASILKSVAEPNKLKIDIMYLDLCDLKSIREFVKAFKSKYHRTHSHSSLGSSPLSSPGNVEELF